MKYLYYLLFSFCSFTYSDAVVKTYEQKSFLYRIYSDFISQSKADTCTMYPSCSEYSRLAFLNLGFVKGVFCTADRLNRSDNDVQFYKKVLIDGKIKNFDPPPNSNIRLPVVEAYDPVFFAGNINISLDITTAPDSDVQKLDDFSQYLQLINNYEQAINENLRLIRNYPNSKYKKDAYIRLYSLYYITNDYVNVIKTSEKMPYHLLLKTERDEFHYWKAASYIHLSNIDKAKSEISKIEKGDTLETQNLLAYGYAKESLYTKAFELHSEYSSDDYESLRYKNPKLAGALAIIPGLGYLYSDHKRSALSALILNGLLAGAAYEAFENDQPILGALFSSIGIGWYAGNIYGSIHAAERYNKNLDNERMTMFRIGFRF
jgi:hypothetical protein